MFSSGFYHWEKSKSDSLYRTEQETGVKIKKKKKYTGHTYYSQKVIYFGSPYFKVVSVGSDSNVVIFDADSGNICKSIKLGTSWAVDLRKMGKSIFLTCCGRHIDAYSIIAPKYRHVKKFRAIGDCIEMMKISEDIFAFCCENSKIYICSFSSQKIIKEIKLCDLFFATKLLPSKVFKNCAYVNTNDAANSIYLVNYESGTINKVFSEHFSSLGVGGDNHIYSICCYQRKGVEILIAPNFLGSIYFYDTSNDKFAFKKIELKNSNLSIGGFVSNRVYDSLVVSNKYLILGDGNGKVSVSEIASADSYSGGSMLCYELKNLLKPLASSQIHCNCITSLETSVVSVYKLRVFTTSWDKTSLMAEIKGLEIIQENVKQQQLFDLLERIEFCFNNTEQFLFINEEEKSLFFYISLPQKEVKIFKCLVCQ